MKKFNIPENYRSTIVTSIKKHRTEQDQKKRDITPSIITVGDITFKIARHFGFCYGVENAIEIAFRAIDENPGKRVFLLSEMIHNPMVNADLEKKGVKFLMTPDGERKIPFSELSPDDVVIVPAFGTTVELFSELTSLGINPRKYNATCPFVEKVWNRSEQLGNAGFTVVIHGKHYHEETRATFSHAKVKAPSIVIRNMEEARLLASYFFITKNDQDKIQSFHHDFGARYSEEFDPILHLSKIGVVNQTTMLAGETESITNFFREIFISHFGEERSKTYIADTKDTLCYATSENQSAIQGMVASGGDIAVVIGGYNSSNTTHLAKLCSKVCPTYTVKDADEIVSLSLIKHLDLGSLQPTETADWLPSKRPLSILISAGASSPDALVDQVIEKICEVGGVKNFLTDAVGTFCAIQ
jgi:4-hydroxy-3-methylbut-2-enyl diphosphate reductase